MFLLKNMKNKKRHIPPPRSSLGPFLSFSYIYLAIATLKEKERGDTFLKKNPVLPFDLENVFSIYSKSLTLFRISKHRDSSLFLEVAWYFITLCTVI